ncbi:ABC transporter permease [Trinickia dabaoshanensis]|uniref:ABC transporter permease n=1 Tax=Trinickia dabaoshanensis TaxID=564714 RepID=A0A2N7VEX0_9BURK|nr:ABC transporter permease [Trinickia dabaoshanensis]PMS15695.1 ABC transporter permease [Trinickia dabaoshanensis]
MERSLEMEIKRGTPAPSGQSESARAPRKRRQPAVVPLDGVRRLGIRLAFTVVSIGVPLLLWYLGTRYRVQFYIRFQSVPTPMEVFHTAVQVAGSDAFAANIVNSLRRIFLGFLVALASGVAMGLVIGRYRIVNQLLMPAIEVLRPIPAIAWVPLSIMLWPTTESSIVFITFIGAFYPILLNTVDGVQSLDGVLLRAGRCLGASEAQLFWHVILPGVLPNIFTGLAVGMGVAWVSLIAAEMISGQYGVGYYTWEAYSLVNYPAIVLGMITIGALGLLCSGAIRVAGRLSMPWLAYVNGARK